MIKMYTRHGRRSWCFRYGNRRYDTRIANKEKAEQAAMHAIETGKFGEFFDISEKSELIRRK